MSDFDDLRLSVYYLNARRLEALTGADIPVVAQESLNRNSGERAEAMRYASRLANDILKHGDIPNLASLMAAGDLDGKNAIATIWGVFTFRGLSDSLMCEQQVKTPKPATFSATIPLGDREYEL